MSLLYPAKSLRKYTININNKIKEIIIIGETHINKLNKNIPDVITTWRFIENKMDEGYSLNLELEPDFKKNIDFIKKNIQSINIRETLKILTKKNNKKKLNNTNGLDVRRKNDFFGIFKNHNIQGYFFNKSSELLDINIWDFLRVIKNMMLFSNKHFYNGIFKDLILNINKDFLQQLFNHHKKTDDIYLILNDIIISDSKNKPKGTFYYFRDIIPLLKKYKTSFNFNQMIDTFRDFILIFTDLLILIEIITNNNNNDKHILLIGEAHAKNLEYFLKSYISYPYKHPKMSMKQIKFAGKEVKKNQVFIKYLR